MVLVLKSSNRLRSSSMDGADSGSGSGSETFIRYRRYMSAAMTIEARILPTAIPILADKPRVRSFSSFSGSCVCTCVSLQSFQHTLVSLSFPCTGRTEHYNTKSQIHPRNQNEKQNRLQHLRSSLSHNPLEYTLSVWAGQGICDKPS